MFKQNLTWPACTVLSWQLSLSRWLCSEHQQLSGQAQVDAYAAPPFQYLV